MKFGGAYIREGLFSGGACYRNCVVFYDRWYLLLFPMSVERVAIAFQAKAWLDHEQSLLVSGEDTPLYKLHQYVRPQRVWFSSRFL